MDLAYNVSAIKKLAGQTVLYGLSSIVGRFLNYLLVPFYTRIFVPAEYGVVSEFYAYSTFLLVLFTYGMETAYFHFSEKHKDQQHVFSNSLSCVAVTSLVFSAILILFSSSISSALGYTANPEYVIWFALIIALDAVAAIPFARLRQLGKAKKFTLFKLINIFFNIGFNIFFLVIAKNIYEQRPDLPFHFYQPGNGVAYVFLSNLLANVITFLLLLPNFKSFTFKLDKDLLSKMILYALPLMIAGFAGMINETLDRAIYKYLVTDKTSALTQLGIYSACYKIAIIMTLFVQTFRYAAEPFFFSQQHKENSRQLYANVMNYFVLTCSIIFLTVMTYLDTIKFFIGKEYHNGLEVVPVLLMANLCLGIYINLSSWYKLTGETKYGAWFSIIGAVITIGLLFLLVPDFGYIGASWATLICYASMMLTSFFVGQKKFPVPYNVQLILLLVGLSLAFYIGGEKLLANIEKQIYSEIIKATIVIVYIGVGYRLVKRSSMISAS